MQGLLLTKRGFSGWGLAAGLMAWGLGAFEF